MKHKNPYYFNIDPDNTYFTSDTHFFHTKIIEYANRPFESVEEMNDVLISNWNKVISNDTIIFHLGDFSFGGKDNWENVRNRLNGKIHLLLGNHDLQNHRGASQCNFESVSEIKHINVLGDEPRLLILQHYPLLEWPLKDKIWHLHGHTHDSPFRENPIRSITQYDVGIDNNNYTPVSYRDLVTIINTKITNG